VSRTTLVVGCLFVPIAFVDAPVSARAAVCGDVDESEGITTTDALIVLRHAVRLAGAPMVCDACVVPTTTSSTCCYDGCFRDEDCAENDYPADWVCVSGGTNAFCAECDASCPGDNQCINWECINACGDFDANGRIAATDALRTLKAAVGQGVSLQCPGCSPNSLTTTSSN
jgi:hypothetical protein